MAAPTQASAKAPAKAPAKPKWINWQAPMQRVLFALVPTIVAAVYFYGWRALLMLLLVNAAAYGVEYAFTRQWKQPVSSAVFVTGTLFALSLPPTLPFWMAVVGIGFGMLFGKMVFGGFGKNVFNPALTGRAFIYVSFGAAMTGSWVDPVPGTLGGLAAYAADAVTQATPGLDLNRLHTGSYTLLQLLVGRVPGILGGTSALLALLGGAYLLWKQTANYRIVAAATAGFLLAQAVIWKTSQGAAPLPALLSASTLFGFLFFATDPVSACMTNAGRWWYGAFIGIMSALIGKYSSWPAGTMFAILLANLFAPITDHVIREIEKKRAAPEAAEA